jgi:hypothetical protein
VLLSSVRACLFGVGIGSVGGGGEGGGGCNTVSWVEDLRLAAYVCVLQIGGLLFAVEEGTTHWYRALVWRIFFCTMVGVLFSFRYAAACVDSSNSRLLSVTGRVVYARLLQQWSSGARTSFPLSAVLLRITAQLFASCFVVVPRIRVIGVILEILVC